MPRLYWTDDRPETGWQIVRSDDGTAWNAEQLGGPGFQTAATLPALMTKLGGEDTALQRRYTEKEIRQALPEGTDVAPIVTRLRTQAGA